MCQKNKTVSKQELLCPRILNDARDEEDVTGGFTEIQIWKYV